MKTKAELKEGLSAVKRWDAGLVVLAQVYCATPVELPLKPSPGPLSCGQCDSKALFESAASVG